MNAAFLIQLSLGLLQSVLSTAKGQDLATEVVEDVQAAVAKLLSVQGTPVTWQQLNDLRVEPKW